jgi:hypothetical protein
MKKIGFIFFGLMSLLIFTSLRQQAQAQLNADVGIGSIRVNIDEVMNPDGGWIRYPQEYSVYGSMGCAAGAGFVIAHENFSTNWLYTPQTGWTLVDPPTVTPYFASESTSRYYLDTQHSTVPFGFTRYWKYKAPLRIVNDKNFSDTDWQSYDEVGSNMICDQMIVATCNTASGITLIQRAYSFGDPKYDDFIIVEYVFKNTGNIDRDADLEYPDNKVSQCYIGLKMTPQPSGLTGRIISNAGGWNEQVDDWVDYYAGEYNGEPIRILYGWDGDAAASYYPLEDEGDPLPASGILMSPQYPGMAILHVDKAVDDPTNNPDQPIMSYYSHGGAFATNLLSITQMGAQGVHHALSTPGFFTSPLDWDIWNTTQSEVWAVDNNPNREHYKTGTMGFGPYNFNSIGDSVRIIACFTVGSMGWMNAVEIGKQYKNGEIALTEKNQWLRSGRDSLFAKVSQVIELFKGADGNFDLVTGAVTIGDPPEPPGLTYRSAVGGIVLEWNDVGANKYRIYRRLKPSFSLDDAPAELVKESYPLLKELNADEIMQTEAGLLTWTDEDAVYGHNYWYCITAVNEAGIESSIFLTRTEPSTTDPTRGSASPIFSPPQHLDSVTVVPNPYHIKSERLYQAYGVPQRTITFVGLPAQCRIRIYTQSADLVATLQHELTDPPNSTEQWGLLTDSDQYIGSGIYLFAIDEAKDHEGNDLGITKVGKFIVIR